MYFKKFDPEEWKYVNQDSEGKIDFLIYFYFPDQRPTVCIFLGFKAKTTVQGCLEIDQSHYRPGRSTPQEAESKGKEERQVYSSNKCTEEFSKSRFYVILNS